LEKSLRGHGCFRCQAAKRAGRRECSFKEDVCRPKPEPRTCMLTDVCRSQYYYTSKKDDSAVIEALDELSAKHPVYGFGKLRAYLRRAGKGWNHKKVYRVYKLLKMNKKRRGKCRLPLRSENSAETARKY